MVVIVVAALFFAFNAYIYHAKQTDPSTVEAWKKTTFVIDGMPLVLGERLQYFGNELLMDINEDGREDRVFVVTDSPGGSGTFFYVVAAVNTETGYVGTHGYLLGDRIAPQTTEVSHNPNHQGVVVVNFADRALGEPMTTPPSEAKSVYLKLDQHNQWGIVNADFEGEANPKNMTLNMKSWNWERALYNDGREIIPRRVGVFTLTFTDNDSFSATTDCNSVGGSYAVSENRVTFSNIYSTKMYCENSQEADFMQLLTNTASFFFTSRGELILELQYDSGTATFR
jgi:heat shock protein HslJ